MRSDPEQPRCPVCDQRLRSHDDFTAHFQRHQREEERMAEKGSIGPVDGPPLTEEEEKAERAKLREMIERGQVVVLPEAAAQMEEMGLSLDEILAGLIGDEKH